MAGLTGADGSEDVNDFLARIKELGDKKDREDDERARKLEEQILQGRQERAARRAERARSISPTKHSPASSLASAPAPSQPVLGATTPLKPDSMTSQQPSATMISSPLASEPSKPTPPSQSSLTRSNTLSWQQRPGSRGTTPTVRSRPLSMFAAENSSGRSPSATPEPVSRQEKGIAGAEQSRTTSSVGRSESPKPKGSPNAAAASMLAGKDPNWFKQTADRGVGSAAYRKSEEPSDSDQLGRGGSIRLHGMSRESTAEPEKTSSSMDSLRGRPQSMISPPPSLDAVRLEPDSGLDRTPTMSPAQGRISPERSDRPASPTKGMGGFVQSAMMKRSDSVNKRWSANVPGGLSRHSSVASNRGSRDLGQITFMSPSPSADTQVGNTMPASSDADQSTPIRDKDGFVKPALPQTPQEPAKTPPPEHNLSRPSSPTKDAKRWSPTKASWLENSINKPESPKVMAPASRQQPAWMAALKEAKAARASTDLGRPADTFAKPTSQDGKAIHREPVITPKRLEVASHSTPDAKSTPDPAISEPKPAEETSKSEETFVDEASVSRSPEAAMEAIPAGKGKAPAVKSKPETPPKKDFRSNLKSRAPGPDKSSNNEPEFKKAFGALKRAETKNYKAPDTLKENIMRGKTSLSVTGGPQQTKRVDEFKESLVAKKKEFSAAPSKPLTRNPSQLNEQPVPEALSRRTGMLNRTQSSNITPGGQSDTKAPVPQLKPSTSAPEKPSSPGVVAPSGLKTSALAARFNPNLAGLIAKGAPPVGTARGSSNSAKSTDGGDSNDASAQKGPELTHQTKGRARGPKRKPPSSASEGSGSSNSRPTATANAPTAKLSEQKTSENQSPEQSSSIHAKLESYNQIKAGLIGDVGKLDALGISDTPRPENEGSSVSGGSPSTSQGGSRASLAIDKSKPPALRSPSTRVSSQTISPKPSRTADEPKSEPLSTLNNSSNKMNTSDRSVTPASSTSPKGESVLTPKPPSPSKVKSPPTPGVKRVSTIAKSETPPRSSSSTFRSSPLASPSLSQKTAKSPPVPAKSSTARNMPSSFGAPTKFLSESESDNPVKRTIEEFFGAIPPPPKVPVNIGTQSLINGRGPPEGKIKSLRKQIWELTVDGKRLPMPPQGEHILFEDSMYICTHVFGSSTGKHTTEAYLWIGDGVSPSSAEDAQLFARNAAKEVGAGGRLIVIHQGKESGNFFEALGGIVITRKGSGSTASATYMLCGRQHMKQIAFDEVEYQAASLCSGFPFIISGTGGRLFLWKGKGANASELGCARLIAMDLCQGGDVEEIDEDHEPDQFWDMLGTRDRPNSSAAQHWHIKASKETFATRLFAIDDARPKSAGLAAIQGIQAVWNRRQSTPTSDDPGTADIREISPYAQSDLAQDGIFVLDAYFEVYVILGWRSSARFPAFRTALSFAQDYAILASSQEFVDRPFVPGAHIIFAGASAPYLRAAFRKWDDRRVTTQPVGSTSETEMLPVQETLRLIMAE